MIWDTCPSARLYSPSSPVSWKQYLLFSAKVSFPGCHPKSFSLPDPWPCDYSRPHCQYGRCRFSRSILCSSVLFMPDLELYTSTSSINTAGYTKKAILSALCFIANCVSNIIDPQFFKAKQARLYPLDGRHSRKQHPEYLDIVLCIASYLKESRKRETATAAIWGDSQEAHFDTDFTDLTIMQNPHFRYVW